MSVVWCHKNMLQYLAKEENYRLKFSNLKISAEDSNYYESLRNILKTSKIKLTIQRVLYLLQKKRKRKYTDDI